MSERKRKMLIISEEEEESKEKQKAKAKVIQPLKSEGGRDEYMRGKFNIKYQAM